MQIVRSLLNLSMALLFGAASMAHFPGWTKAPAPHYEWLQSLVPPWIPGSAAFHVLWTGVVEVRIYAMLSRQISRTVAFMAGRCQV
jgi:hypothetical protein